jgi:acetoacetate decarboxylase
MARPDPTLRYLMPAIAGYEPGTAGTWYHDVTGLSVTFRTHREAVQALLPDRFSVGAGPDGEPLVTVSWAANRGVDWLAGGGYNLVGVNVAATYQGEVDTVAGGYCVILWEDATEPILTGREQTGIPKVYADITDLTPRNGGFAVSATVAPPGPGRRAATTAGAAVPGGHPIVELEVEGLRPLPEPEVRAMEQRSRAGRVRFFPSTFERNPTHWQVVNLLCQLEPLEVRSAFLTHGKTRLFAGRARALR